MVSSEKYKISLTPMGVLAPIAVYLLNRTKDSLDFWLASSGKFHNFFLFSKLQTDNVQYLLSICQILFDPPCPYCHIDNKSCTFSFNLRMRCKEGKYNATKFSDTIFNIHCPQMNRCQTEMFRDFFYKTTFPVLFLANKSNLSNFKKF